MTIISPGYFRYYLAVHDKAFWISNKRIAGWVHAVVNFIGPNEGQGLRVYNDGIILGNNVTTVYPNGTYPPPSDGRIFIGREDFTTTATNFTIKFYGSVEVDEFLIYNRTLTEPEIILLNQNSIYI